MSTTHGRTVAAASLIDLLQRHDPGVLGQLRKKHVEHAESVLRGGKTLGIAEDAIPVYVDAAIASLHTAVQRTHPNLGAIRRRLARAKNLRLYGALVATASSIG